MDISTISKFYRLESIKVKPDQLLLDPNNPRIVLDVNTERKFTEEQLVSTEVQQYILSVVNKQTHHIAELIRGIRSSGFIDKGDDMIVKQIPNTKKFLVLEGNRRTTAIKHLLSDDESLRATVRDTLGTLHVKQFIYKPNPEFSEEAVIDILLGTIHITGRLPWGALEKAYYIYNSYLREMRKYRRSGEFDYMVNCSREVAAFFNMSVKGVRKEIIVYRVYEQLKEEGYEVKAHHFSLINMAVTDRQLSEDYFELSPVTLRFSSRGLAHFDKLCVRTEKPISNPKDFRQFAEVYRNGTEYEVSLIESNTQSVSSVLDRVNGRQGEREFLSRLEDILERLEVLEPAGFRGIKGEIDAIREIKDLVDEKLWRLAGKG